MPDLADNLPSSLDNRQAFMVPAADSPEVRLDTHGISPVHDVKKYNDDTRESKNSDDFFGPPLKPTVSEESSGDNPPRRVSGQLCNYHDMNVVWWDETGCRERQSDVEDVEKYIPGGFHPVDIHDRLQNGRYEVIAKLGHGGYGIVWLCRDLKKNAWRAVKILTARHSQRRSTDWKAVQMLQDIGATREQWEAAHIQLPIDHFWVEGPNGRHMCLVLPLLGPDLKSIGETEPHVLKDYLLQIAHGLHFLHKRNIGHGDIRPRNILLKLEDISHISKSEMMKLLGPPIKEFIRRVSDEFPPEYAPMYVVEPADVSRLPVTNEVAIIDFGVSFHADRRHKRIGIPSQFAAPECLFGCYPGLGADVWAFICTISDVLTGGSILKGEKSDYLFYLEVLLGPLAEPYRTAFLDEWGRTPLLQQKLPNINQMDVTTPRGTMSPLSTTYAKLEACRRVCMDDNGGNMVDVVTKVIASRHFLRREDNLTNRCLGTTDQPYIFSSDEVEMLADLFGKVLKYDEKERLTITEVIQHDWFQAASAGRHYQQENKEEAIFEQQSVPGEKPVPREIISSEGSATGVSLAEELYFAEKRSVSDEPFISEEGSVSEESSILGEISASEDGSVFEGKIQDRAEHAALAQEKTARSISVESAGTLESTHFDPEPVEIQEVEPDSPITPEPEPETIKPWRVESKPSKVDAVDPEPTDVEPIGTHTATLEPVDPEIGEPVAAELEPPMSESSHTKESKVSQEEPLPTNPSVSTHGESDQPPTGIQNTWVPVEQEPAGKSDPVVFKLSTPKPPIPELVATRPATPEPDPAKETEISRAKPVTHTNPPSITQHRREPSPPPASTHNARMPVISPTSTREVPAARARRLALVAFVSATAVWVAMFAVFLAGARFGGRTPAARPGGGGGRCEPGYVFAQTRRLSAHTTFFEGLMAFPEPQAREDGQECPVFRNMEVESEIVPVRL